MRKATRAIVAALSILTGLAGASDIAVAQEATPEAAVVEGFIPLAADGSLVAICATCDPAVEVTTHTVDDLTYAEYNRDEDVPDAAYNFFLLAPLASWCTDAGGTLEVGFDRGAILRTNRWSAATRRRPFRPI